MERVFSFSASLAFASFLRAGQFGIDGEQRGDVNKWGD